MKVIKLICKTTCEFIDCLADEVNAPSLGARLKICHYVGMICCIFICIFILAFSCLFASSDLC